MLLTIIYKNMEKFLFKDLKLSLIIYYNYFRKEKKKVGVIYE